ncbi:MAG: response regulator [Gemmatimonadetes bacterium]|nr:MAG: response regulator [Gemmatimonadota bacterium]
MARILIVNDTPHLLQLLGQTLKKETDYEVIKAYDGKSAIEKINTEHPDLVVLDVVMPEMDGFEVCRRIRQNPETEDLPVIMFSALRSGRDDLAHGYEIGADAYLTDIFQPDQLLTQIRFLLRRSMKIKALKEENQRLTDRLQERQDRIDQAYLEIEKLGQDVQQNLRNISKTLSTEARSELSPLVKLVQEYVREVLDLFEGLEPRRKTVLIVDDEELVRHMIELKLKKTGFSVLTAVNGREALDVLRDPAHHVDLVICDAMMPELDGFGLVGTIRKQISTDLPVVMITAKFENEVLQNEQDRWQFDAFFTKPFDLSELYETVKRLIQERENV